MNWKYKNQKKKKKKGRVTVVKAYFKGSNYFLSVPYLFPAIEITKNSNRLFMYA